MMAGPLIILYEIGILVARMARKKKVTEEETTEEVVEG
jgi:Sec-independent protein secretion pathway component TatC